MWLLVELKPEEERVPVGRSAGCPFPLCSARAAWHKEAVWAEAPSGTSHHVSRPDCDMGHPGSSADKASVPRRRHCPHPWARCPGGFLLHRKAWLLRDRGGLCRSNTQSSGFRNCFPSVSCLGLEIQWLVITGSWLSPWLPVQQPEGLENILWKVSTEHISSSVGLTVF